MAVSEGIIHEKLVKARQTHFCEHCRRPILKGEEYTRASMRFEDMVSSDPPYTAKLCLSCHLPKERRTTPETDGYRYIRDYYKVPVAVGQRIMAYGKMGTVKPSNRSAEHYVNVLFDGAKRPEVAHPTWETVYYAEDGVTILADYRKVPAPVEDKPKEATV